MDGTCYLMTYKEAAQVLRTSVGEIYQLRLKAPDAFPCEGYVDLEYFAKLKLAYDNNINEARRVWIALQNAGYKATAVAKAVNAMYPDVSMSAVRTMLRRGLWTKVKRRQFFWRIPKTVKYFLKWSKYVSMDRH